MRPMSCVVHFFAADIRESVVLRSEQTYILNFCDLPGVFTSILGHCLKNVRCIFTSILSSASGVLFALLVQFCTAGCCGV